MLGDFGIACLTLDKSDEIQIGLAGTLKYMSPEALKNTSMSPKDHAKSDVWLVILSRSNN